MTSVGVGMGAGMGVGVSVCGKGGVCVCALRKWRVSVCDLRKYESALRRGAHGRLPIHWDGWGPENAPRVTFLKTRSCTLPLWHRLLPPFPNPSPSPNHSILRALLGLPRLP